MKTIIEMAQEAGLRSAVLLRLYGKPEALCESELEELEQIKKFAELVTEQANNRSNAAWVGLTDAEITAIVGPWGSTPIKGYTRELFDKIEAKLKEKNFDRLQ